MAEARNREGNTQYLAGHLVNAKKAYEEAEALDPNEPKYPSNLSAVLYEQGKYKSSLRAITRSWKKLDAVNQAKQIPVAQLSTDPLALKLATRYAKAKINAAINGKTHLHPDSAPSATDEAEAEAVIEKFIVELNPDPLNAKHKDLSSSWDHWKALRDKHKGHTSQECLDNIAAAESRLKALPIFKSPCDPDMELFCVGHDEVHSLLDGLDFEKEDEYALDIFLFEVTSKDLSFLFGGSGDARHVFATLIHVARQYEKMPLDKDALKAHTTLVDIHPATLARTIIVFELIRRILITEDKTKQLELKTTLFYLYLSVVMPDYCYQIVRDVAKLLSTELTQKSHALFNWLFLNDQSIPSIVNVLEYWSTRFNKSTKVLIQLHNGQNAMGSGASLYGSPSKHPKARSGQVQDPYDNPEMEHQVYNSLKILLPPKGLLDRNPALSKFINSYKSQQASPARAAASREIEEQWKPNFTFFDEHSTENPNFGKLPSYPHVPWFPEQTLQSFASVNRRFSAPMKLSGARTAFTLVAGFFDLVSSAIRILNKRLKVEIVASEVTLGLSKLVTEQLGQRPSDFPVQFTRMWLSNVPDYTHGTLNAAIHIMPYLQEFPLALYGSNCLANTGAFKSIAEYCYNYTLLLPQELPQLLGCNLLTLHGSAFDDVYLEALPLPLAPAHLARKAVVHKWLCHLLLCTICPVRPQLPPYRVELPNNIVNLFHVLNHLYTIGYPSHWLGDFVQSLVSDNLVTDMKPYLGLTPISQKERFNQTPSPRRVNLQPWRAEFEVILAMASPALPFFVDIPKDYPSLEDIRTFKATITPLDFRLHPQFRLWQSLSSPFYKSAGLLFYKPGSRYDGEGIVKRLPKFVEAGKEVEGLDVQFMLSQEVVNFRTGELAWKMSVGMYEKMKREEWKMVVYRTDLLVLATEPLDANFWVVA